VGRKLLVPTPDLSVVPDLYYSPARPANCTNAWFFGQDVARSCANRRHGGATLDVIGSPVFHDTYAEIDGGNAYFDTGQTDTAEMTVLALVRLHTTGDACTILDNLGGGFGARLVVTATSNNIQMAGAYGGPSIQSQMTPSGFSTAPLPWRCLIGTVGAVGSGVYDMTTGRADTDANADALDRTVGVGSMLIGGGGASGTYIGNFDLACLMTWDAVLSADERNQAYQAAQGLYADLGISI